MGRTILRTREALNELERMSRRGVLASRRLSIRLRRMVLNAYDQGMMPELRETIMREYTPTLRDSMIVAHLIGIRLEREMFSKASGLKLSVYDKTLERMAKNLDLDLTALQLQYHTQALKVANDVSDTIEVKMRQSVNELIAEGALPNEAKRALAESFEKLGVSGRKDYQLETIYRTQSSLAMNAGRWEADRDPAVQEILWGYEYSATGDDRTRPEHMALDGTRLPKDDPFWEKFWPPNGWNCRCQVIPIFIDSEEATVRQPTEDDVAPDRGFEFNAGRVFYSGRAL